MKKCFLLLLLATTFANIQAQISHTVSFTQAPVLGTEVMADGNTYTTINLKDAITDGEIGKPALPFKTVQLLVPSNAKNFSIAVNSYTTTTYNLSYRVTPAQEPIPTSFDTNPPFVAPDSATYNSTTYFPSQIASIYGKGIFRGNHILSLTINPVRYYPSQNRVEFYNNISLTLSYTLDGQPTNTNIVVRDKVKCRKMLSSIVANISDINSFSTVNNTATVGVAKSASLLPSDCKYVVVTTRRLAPAFDDFVFWKTRKGVKTAVVTIEDIKANYYGDSVSHIYDDAGKLRQFLKDAYNNGGGIEYALLAADSLPIRYQRRRYTYVMGPITKTLVFNKVPGDVYYSDLNSNWNVDGDTCFGNYPSSFFNTTLTTYDSVDFYPEIFVGRIQPQNEWEVKNWTRKIVQYEKSPGNGDYSYLTKGFYQQSDQSQMYNSARKIAGKVLWCPDTTVFEEEGGYGSASDSLRLPQFPKGKDFIDKFNEHFGFCGVFAHGSPTNFACATKGLNADSIVLTDNSKYSVLSLRGCYRTPVAVRENGNSFEDMTNQAYPTIFYTTSCQTNSYDMWDRYGVYQPSDRSMGDVYTCVSIGGGPAYLGNTRTGHFGPSDTLFERFAQYIFKGLPNIGIAEAMSKTGVELFGFKADPILRIGHNLTGCPETEIWTAIPSVFNNVQITENGTTITVNTGGVDSCTICVMSPFDGGANYYDVRKNVGSATFTNVVGPYIVTITKHNYIPYLQDLPDEYIQNEIFTGNNIRIGGNIYAGKNVTTQKPQGNVIIRSGAKLKLQAQKNVYLEKGFEVEMGGKLEVKKTTND
ncbi:MAG: hypothetical protein J6T33_05315 [Bacteroidales bacterium]|nr:hypothetical protein [Bacteroidales bacterium]